MEIVKLVNNPCDTDYALENLCSYIIQYDRTGGYVRGRGLRPTCAVEAMDETMELWNTKFGRRAYHIVVSFPDELVVLPDEAMDIGQKISDLFFPTYQILWGVHKEQAHMHIHFGVCTTSLMDGRKLHMDYTKMTMLENTVENIVGRYFL